MTCIVGLAQGGEVYIGGDSAGVGGWSLQVRDDAKVFRNGEFVMGFTTSFRMGQLLRYSFAPPRIPKSGLFGYMVGPFMDSIRKTMKDGGFAKVDNNVEKGGTFLVGVRGRLFRVDEDFQVGQTRCGYDACGVGQDAARGSLYSTRGNDPKWRVRTALGASEAHNIGVVRPFRILATNRGGG